MPSWAIETSTTIKTLESGFKTEGVKKGGSPVADRGQGHRRGRPTPPPPPLIFDLGFSLGDDLEWTEKKARWRPSFTTELPSKPDRREAQASATGSVK
jgi:hypothetical protein